MPRPRKQASQASHAPLHSGQASYVLERLIADRRISPGEINRYVSDMHREISHLEQRLSSLRTAAGSAASAGSASQSGENAPRKRGRPVGSGRKAGAARAGASASSSSASAPAAARGRRRGRPAKNAGAAAASNEGGAAQEQSSSKGAKRGRKARTNITPEQLASRQLQGRYLGLIRQIPASKRAAYQKTAKDKGREAAIREMEETLKK